MLLRDTSTPREWFWWMSRERFDRHTKEMEDDNVQG
jgi:hypothetical protein